MDPTTPCCCCWPHGVAATTAAATAAALAGASAVSPQHSAWPWLGEWMALVGRAARPWPFTAIWRRLAPCLPPQLPAAPPSNTVSVSGRLAGRPAVGLVAAAAAAAAGGYNSNVGRQNLQAGSMYDLGAAAVTLDRAPLMFHYCSAAGSYLGHGICLHCL